MSEPVSLAPYAHWLLMTSKRPAPKRKPTAKRRPPARRREDEAPPRAAQWAGVVTSLIKLGGLGVAVNEAVISTAPGDTRAYFVAVFMMAGAEGVDSVLRAVLGNREPPGGSDR